jgi:hypothetical protein
VRRWCITPGESNLQGSFCFTIGHRSYALENAPGHCNKTFPSQHGSVSVLARSLSLRSAGDPRRPATYGGLSEGSMKMKERSKDEVGSFIRQGTPPARVQAILWNSASHANSNRPHRDTWVAGLAAAATPTHSGRYALPFFHMPHNVAA